MGPRRIFAGVAALVAIVTALVIPFRKSARGVDHAISGELVGYDASTGGLTLRTEEGEGRFIVPAGATVHEGAKAIPLADLSSATGYRVKLWYRDVRGQLTVRDIRVSHASNVQAPLPTGTARTSRP